MLLSDNTIPAVLDHPLILTTEFDHGVTPGARLTRVVPLCVGATPHQWPGVSSDTGRSPNHISSFKALVKKHNESPTGLLKPILLSFDNEGGPEEEHYEELEDLRKPYKEVLKSPFSRRIIEFSAPKHRTPTNLKIYDGSTDPDDHITHFVRAANQGEWEMLVWCKMFQQTLDGPARGWFDCFSNGRIDNWTDLREAFVERFALRRKCCKDPTEVTKIDRRANETLTDFKERWTEEMSYIPDVSVVMQISAFMSKSKYPELARRFSDQVPQTVTEMMRRVDDFVKSEEVFKNTELPKGEHPEKPAVAQFRGSRPPRHSYGSRPSRADIYRKGDHYQPYVTPRVPDGRYDNRRREVNHQNLDSLAKLPSEILATELQLRLPPCPLTVAPPKEENLDRYCDYHGEKGHYTNDCFHLKTVGDSFRVQKTQSFDQRCEAKRSPNLNEVSGILGQTIDPYWKDRTKGRTGLPEIRVISSTIHVMMKFPTPKGIATICAREKPIYESRCSERKVVKQEETVKEMEETRSLSMEEDEKVLVNPAFPEQTITIGTQFSAKCREQPGTYCYVKMPFGLKNARATYQRLIDSAFQTQLGRNLEAYVDDMVIKSKIEQDMIMDIAETFNNLRKINMKLNPMKCSLKAIADMQSPKTLKKIKSLSGKLAALNRFLSSKQRRDGKIPGLSKRASGTIQEVLNSKYSKKSKPKGGCAKQVSFGRLQPSDEGDTSRSIELKVLGCSGGPLQANYIIREVHEGACGMHAGVRSVVAKIMRQWYYWPTVHGDTKEGLDILGPLPEGPDKLKFIIVAIDYFTKWIEAKPLAKNIDNETQLVNDPFKSWCEKWKIKQMNMAVVHPQANGLVERANKSLMHGLKARLGRERLGWVDELPNILWAHRTMLKTSNGETPFSLTYGSEVVILAEIKMPTYRTIHFNESQNEEEMRLNLDLSQGRRETTAIREAKYKKKVEQYHNKRVRPMSFKVGDFVYRKNAASRVKNQGKLGPNWEGPYRVTEAYDNGSYKLATMNDREVPRTWNIINL
nr:reverse transcriptase domain-containing protein [Tanacetum cinerariifolium]